MLTDGSVTAAKIASGVVPDAYTKTQADATFYSKTQADTTFYSKTQADATFLKYLTSSSQPFAANSGNTGVIYYSTSLGQYFYINSLIHSE